MKFPLDSIYYLFNILIQKYRTANFRGFDKNISFLREIKNEMLISFNLFKGKTGKIRNCVNKKLNHLIRIAVQILVKLNKEELIGMYQEDEILKLIIEKFLKQSSGSYLRMEDTEELYRSFYCGKYL